MQKRRLSVLRIGGNDIVVNQHQRGDLPILPRQEQHPAEHPLRLASVSRRQIARKIGAVRILGMPCHLRHAEARIGEPGVEIHHFPRSHQLSAAVVRPAVALARTDDRDAVVRNGLLVVAHVVWGPIMNISPRIRCENPAVVKLKMSEIHVMMVCRPQSADFHQRHDVARLRGNVISGAG